MLSAEWGENSSVSSDVVIRFRLMADVGVPDSEALKIHLQKRQTTFLVFIRDKDAYEKVEDERSTEIN